MSYGQNPWPPLGSSVGHQRAGLLSVTGQVLLTVDTPIAKPGFVGMDRVSARKELEASS